MLRWCAVSITAFANRNGSVAHRTSPVRNASVFVTHAFDVRGAHERCVLQVRLLRVSRPGGGGNQFKLRTLQVITARPEAQLSGSTSRPVHA